MFDRFKSERGFIAVYLLVVMLILLAIVTGKYLLANKQLESQMGALKNIQDKYERTESEEQSNLLNVINSTTDSILSEDDDTESEVSAETAETVETEENADETVTVEE